MTNQEETLTLQVEKHQQDFLKKNLAHFDFVKVLDDNRADMKKDNKILQRFTGFKLPDVKNLFELEEQEINLFTEIQDIKPSDWLKESLLKAKDRKLNNEKIRSEALVYPIAYEIEKISLECKILC